MSENQDVYIFDDVLNVLQYHDHPCILVGVEASRWMGCCGFLDPPGIDMLIRDSQLRSITSDILATGNWVPAEDPEIDELIKCDLVVDADVAFQRKDMKNDGNNNYLRLWSEETYHLDVDENALVEVPDIYAWIPFLIEEQYHPAINREDSWWYGPRTPTKPNGGKHFLPKLPRGKSAANPSRIFVPTVPKFLDALVYMTNHYQDSKPKLVLASSWEISLLVRYLYLELPHQATVIEFEVEFETEVFLQARFARYVRKPFYVLSKQEGKLQQVLVKPHDPDSYPEDVRKSCFDRLQSWDWMDGVEPR